MNCSICTKNNKNVKNSSCTSHQWHCRSDEKSSWLQSEASFDAVNLVPILIRHLESPSVFTLQHEIKFMHKISLTHACNFYYSYIYIHVAEIETP